MEAVFVQILNMSISAGWLILAVILVRLLLRRAPRWVSVLLLGIVGIRLIMPFSIESGLSLLPSAQTVSPAIGTAARPSINSGIPAFDSMVNPILGTSLAADPFGSANPMQIWLFIGELIWLAGIASLLLYGLISYVRLRRKVAEAIPYQDHSWLCDHISSPFILGVFRPRIYLPSWLDDREMEYVLAHERAHLKRKDHYWKPLGFLLLSVYWFHPLVWAAYILLCRDIEVACDEKVISEMELQEKKAYASALVSCSMQRKLVLACPLAFGEVGVKERVKGVLKYKKPGFWIILASITAWIAVCFLASPQDEDQDLSFLNYKNAISLIGQNGIDYVIHYPPEGNEIQIGDAEDRDVIQYLSSVSWKQRRFSPRSLSSPGSVQFVIEEGYRITVYQSPRIACVQFAGESRYYNAGRNDYEEAVKLIHDYTVQNAGAVSFDTGEYVDIEWLGHRYVPFCAVSNTDRGTMLAIVNGDEKDQIYEYKGYSPKQWIISFYHSGLMDASMLMREESVTDIPDHLESEYIWNHFDLSPAEVFYGTYRFSSFAALTIMPQGEEEYFSFGFDPFSSYLNMGSAVRRDDRLICTTYDGQYTYVFSIKDAQTLVFDEKRSDSVKLFDPRVDEPIVDGSEFKLELDFPEMTVPMN